MKLKSINIVLLSLVSTACIVPMCVGCGGNQLRYVPAAGTVTVDGKPINRAEVVLLCDDVTVKPRPTTRGVTDASGHFVLKSLTPDKRLVEGAVVGRHHVAITTQILELDAHGATRVVREELLGKPYTSGELLTTEIPAGGVPNLHFEAKGEKSPAAKTVTKR